MKQLIAKAVDRFRKSIVYDELFNEPKRQREAADKELSEQVTQDMLRNIENNPIMCKQCKERLKRFFELKN